MSENSIEFSLSNSEQRDSWLNSSHQTLDADMMRCLPIYGKKKREKKEKVVKKTEKDRDEEVLKKLVFKRFWRWKKIFGKKESERMLVQKAWDHAIELKEGFVLKKRKVYSLLREEKEKVQAFVEDQLRKGYI